MTDDERTKLVARFWGERLIADIHSGKVVDGDPATWEDKCLEEQDAIEFQFGDD